jgi:hypothetical protein
MLPTVYFGIFCWPGGEGGERGKSIILMANRNGHYRSARNPATHATLTGKMFYDLSEHPKITAQAYDPVNSQTFGVSSY